MFLGEINNQLRNKLIYFVVFAVPVVLFITGRFWRDLFHLIAYVIFFVCLRKISSSFGSKKVNTEDKSSFGDILDSKSGILLPIFLLILLGLLKWFIIVMDSYGPRFSQIIFDNLRSMRRLIQVLSLPFFVFLLYRLQLPKGNRIFDTDLKENILKGAMAIYGIACVVRLFRISFPGMGIFFWFFNSLIFAWVIHHITKIVTKGTKVPDITRHLFMYIYPGLIIFLSSMPLFISRDVLQPFSQFFELFQYARDVFFIWFICFLILAVSNYSLMQKSEPRAYSWEGGS